MCCPVLILEVIEPNGCVTPLGFLWILTAFGSAKSRGNPDPLGFTMGYAEPDQSFRSRPKGFHIEFVYCAVVFSVGRAECQVMFDGRCYDQGIRQGERRLEGIFFHGTRMLCAR